MHKQKLFELKKVHDSERELALRSSGHHADNSYDNILKGSISHSLPSLQPDASPAKRMSRLTGLGDL